ncbi:MAG: CPBP family intramembrane metalloprotease [Saprospiraceae bacterium]|nr:CPBP family intramembrane metalloprotease [Saprospiraceae bacterium]
MTTSNSGLTKAWRLLIRLLGFSLTLLLLTVLFSFVLFQVFGMSAPFGEDTEMTDLNINSMIFFWTALTIATFVAIYLFWIKIDKDSWLLIGLKDVKGWPNFWYGTALGAGMVSTGYVLMLIFGVATFEAGNFVFGSFLAWLIFFLIQPFFEELLFRGYVLRLVERYFSTWAAIIISSILFGLVHAPNDNFSIIGLLSIALSGLLMGWLFVRTNSLWAPTGLHFSWNFFQGVIYGYPTSGINTYEIMANQYSLPEWLSGGDFGFEGSILAVLLLAGVFYWDWKKGKAEVALAQEGLADDLTMDEL